uniref:Transposase-associated domain-containing protein n=1 Tax=Oryza meridionalis TaxID=40149 RepID=A0A0E0DAY6_9ORYZ
MDRSWINSKRFSNEYMDRVNEFMTFVSERFSDDEEMLCPCHRCLNRVRQFKGQVHDHLHIHGMATTYTRWIHHGEPLEVVPHEIDDHVDEHTSLNEDFDMNVDEEDDPDDGIHGMVEELYTAEEEELCFGGVSAKITHIQDMGDFIPANKKQTKFKDVPPTAIDIFKDTHCSSKSGFNENAKDAIAQMEAYVAQPTEEGKDPKTPVEAVAHVLPKSTFLRNVGMQSTEMKKNAKAAAMNDRVRELESELHAEKMESARMQLQIADLQKQLEDQKEAARKNEEETEKLRQQGSEIESFLRSLFGSKFASSDAQQ